MMYFEFLGELSKHFCTLAVAGTHGKSSTTGMLGVTLAQHHPDAALCLV
ncbi:MAG: hypothetical protein H6765_05890 [Candidatus Peribacteria bacterium]|nr:MAG: hypothetical protein H6765_05890 [Candidatus Peribacteria bacterium]